MSEEDILASVRIAAREAERFFSNAAKQEREIWVAREFLSALKIPFSEAELMATPQYSDADVIFRDARFQIKEITEPESEMRRSAELKASRLRAESATCLADLIEPVIGRDIILSNAYLLIHERASAKRYSPGVKAGLDLLCYVTRAYASLGSREEIRRLEAAGWRSISCLYGSRALVLSAAADAPPFLRNLDSSANSDPCSDSPADVGPPMAGD